MKNMTIKTIVAVLAVAGSVTAFGKATSGKISATLFDGKGNKEVLAEAQHVQREPPPALPAPAPAPQTTTTTVTDGKGRTMRTVEQKGDTTVVKDGCGRVVTTTTKNADGSTTVRDGHGTTIEKNVTTGK